MRSIKTSNRRRETIGGGYGQVVEELYHKYNVKDQERFNPCKIAKIMLADDDIMNNLAMRTMIEHDGKYQVFSFYNGVEV